MINLAFFFYTLPMHIPRAGNSHANREAALSFVREWDDEMFQRQFRLCREDFNDILTSIAPLIERKERCARSSSGSSINPELRLYISLRILADARYLDMVHYRVNIDHVMDIVVNVCRAINSTLLNVKMPVTDADYYAIAEEFLD